MEWRDTEALERLVRGMLVGREMETRRLRSAFGDACDGAPRIVAIGGEAGIGKSLLAQEIATIASTEACVVQVNCHGGTGAMPWWPWPEIAETILAPSDREDVAAALDELAPAIERLRLPAVPARHGAPPAGDGDRFSLCMALVRLIHFAARQKPTVLVLEDVHEANEPAQQMLPFLASHLGRSRVLVVATHRLHGAGGGDAESMWGQMHAPIFERIVLGPLEESAMHTFLGWLAGQRVPHPFTSRLHELSGGNPLYLRELLLHLIGADVLFHDGTRWTSRLALDRIRCPPSIRAVIAERVAHVGERCRVALEAASLFRGEFRLDALRRVGILPPGELEDAIDEALRAQLVISVPRQPGGYRFVHGLFREMLYDGIAPARRAAMHLQVATVLERRAADLRDADVYDLAEHLLLADVGGRPRDAIDWARRAAALAMDQLAYERAAEYHIRCLTMGRDADLLSPEERFDLLIDLTEAHQNAGMRQRARDAALAAARIARDKGWPARLARAALAFAGMVRGFVALEYDAAAVDLLEEALGHDGLDEATVARLEARLAEELTFGDGTRREQCSRLVHGALARAERLRDENPVVAGYVSCALHWSLFQPDDAAQRLEIATRIARCAAEARESALAFHGHVLRTLALIELGDVAAARRALQAATKVGRRPADRWTLNCLEGCFAFLEGRLDDVAVTVQRGADLHAAAGVETGQVLLGGQQGHLDWLQGRLEPIEPLIRGLVRTAPLIDMIARCGLAATHAEAGRLDDVRRELGGITRGGLRAISRNPLWTTSICFLAEACASVGDDVLAEELYRMLKPFAGRTIVLPPALCLGSADHFLGILAVTLRDRDGARGHFERAITTNTACGARQWTARSQVAYARLLLGSQGCTNDDRRHAMALLDAAADTAGALELTRLAATIDASKRIVPPNSAVFARTGDEWLLRYGSEEVRLRDLCGLERQHRLLETPYVHVSCVELVTCRADGTEVVERPSAGDPAMDGPYQHEVCERIRELERKIEDAQRRGCSPAPEVLAELEELTPYYGKETCGGRSHYLSPHLERLRVKVRHSLKRLWERMREAGCPHLAAHLERATTTGHDCVYSPSWGERPPWILYLDDELPAGPGGMPPGWTPPGAAPNGAADHPIRRRRAGSRRSRLAGSG